VDKLAETQLELSRGDLSESQRADVIKQIVTLQKSAAEYGVAHNLVQAVRQRAREMQMERLMRDIKKAPKIERLPAYQEMQRFQEQQ